VAPLT